MRIMLISPDDAVRQQLEDALLHHPEVRLSKIFDSYPEPEILSRAVRAWVPEVVFVDIKDVDSAEVICQRMEKEFPTVQRVAVHRARHEEVYRQVLELRMSQLVSPPFSDDEMDRAMATIARHLEIRPAKIGSTQHLYTFIPAKPGVGTSTLAANATWAFSRIPDKRVLLADFDTASGVTGFMFKAEHDLSLADAALRAKSLDDEAWSRLICKSGPIDLLLSGAPRIEEAGSGEQVRQLVEFARRTYDVITVDLPDRLGEMSVAALQEANRIFVVGTPELAVLRLARLKAVTLRKLNLEHKASFVVNRSSTARHLDDHNIEDIVELPVSYSFPSDYHEVTKSIEDGRPSLRLAPRMDEFACRLLDQREPEKKPRFIERFCLMPLRYQVR